MSRHRTTRLLPIAVAVLALSLSACGSDETGGTERTSATSERSASAQDDATTPATALTVDDSSAAGKCMVPNAEALATQPTAFEGTVVALDDGTATLEVDRWFAGRESEQVTVSTPDEQMQSLLVAVDFEVGRTYLVSATGDQVTLCGFTAEKTPELEGLYTEAFGR